MEYVNNPLELREWVSDCAFGAMDIKINFRAKCFPDN